MGAGGKGCCIFVVVLDLVFTLYQVGKIFMQPGICPDGTNSCPEADSIKYMNIGTYIALGFKIFATAVLFKGLSDRNPSLFLFWIIYNFLLNILGTFYSIYIMYVIGDSVLVAISVFAIALTWIMWGCVLKYYNELKSEIENEVQPVNYTA